LEWLGKKPLESEDQINDKLLDELKAAVEKKLSQQSFLQPQKKKVVRIA